jgi:hypothetical protein
VTAAVPARGATSALTRLLGCPGATANQLITRAADGRAGPCSCPLCPPLSEAGNG